MSPTQHTDESPASGYLSTAWPTFEQKLAAVLADLTEDQYLILSVKRSSRFVQFAGQGAFGLRAETTSNSYLPKPEVLDNKQLEALLALGWQPPTGSPDASTPERDPDGSPNFFCDFAAPASCPSVARLAIRTLAEIFRVPHPGFLDYEAFDEQGPLDLSHLGLKLHQETAREGDPNRVRKRLLETFREVTGFADLEYDADGDIGVRIGSALVYARVVQDPLFIRFFAPLLSEVDETDALMTRLNDVNANLTFIKLVKRHRNIFAVSDIPAQPFAAKPIGAAFDHIATVAEGLDKLLQSEFGGSTAFSEPMPSTRKH